MPAKKPTDRVLLAEREEPLQQTALVHHLDAARVQAEREEPLQQTALVHHLDAARVQAERADNPGRFRLLLQHERVHAVQPQLAGQHQAGRSAAGNDHVNHGNPHSTRLHLGQLLRAVRRRAHPHLRAECPQPHCESHLRFDVPRDPNVYKSTRTSRIPDFRRFWLRPEILHTTWVLSQDPRCASRLARDLTKFAFAQLNLV
jgi:hypothetical protein